MPPRIPLSPRPPGRFYGSLVAGLTKVRYVLNLIISDLFRLILAVFLFAVVLIIVVIVLFYKQWFPQVTDFVKSAASDTSTAQPK